MKQFDVPIVLFFFKREHKTLEVIKRIGEVKPSKLYLISDGPRNQEEYLRVFQCRKNVEKAIDWPCEVIKNYAEQNKGVYNRIGLGTLWVFDQEEQAIFLEDDNLPEVSFFRFCKEMLIKYNEDTRILWICGTNYLEKYEPSDGSSYVFTKHMLPCGWASWRHKFPKFYDKDFSLLKNNYIYDRVECEYLSKKMYNYDLIRWCTELERIQKGKQFVSWDFQMSFSIRVHGLYGIVPKYNLIKNIGVDEDSAHGGTSFDNIMVQRFCGISSYPMEFPLIHPRIVLSDLRFEKKINHIVIPPRQAITIIIYDYIKAFCRKIFVEKTGFPVKATLIKYFNKKKHLRSRI